MKKLILDSGSTKCAVLIEDIDFSIKKLLYIPGFNPLLYQNITNSTFAHFNTHLTNIDDVSSIVYCGTGCISKVVKEQVKRGLSKIFQSANIEVYDDLEFIGNVLNVPDGQVIAILGTGANAGLWDQKMITRRTTSGGYLLGDEGSGFALGKDLIINFLRQKFRKKNQTILQQHINKSESEIIQEIYRSQEPNKEIAAYAKLWSVIDDPLKDKVITLQFRSFLNERVQPIKNRSSVLNLVGSIGYHYKEYLEPLLTELNMNLGIVVKNPISSLAEEKDIIK